MAQRLGAVIAAFWLLAAGAARADDGRTVRGVVVGEDGAPVWRATVVVSLGERQLSATTDEDGEFQIAGLTPGPYAVRASFGTAAVQSEVAGDGRLRLVLDVAPEVVRIRELPPAAQPARVKPDFLPRSWAYSDAAIDTNRWYVVWVLALLDSDGRVADAKVVKSPPHVGLDAVALAEVRKLRYDPARDFKGKAIPTQVVVVLEWPPYWGIRSVPPCTSGSASGPLNLDDEGSAYRDCTPPRGLENLALHRLRPVPFAGFKSR